MRATLMHEAGDVRIADVPDAKIVEPTSAVVRITHACICGSDLWPYQQLERTEEGNRMGHEFVGVVEEVGPEVTKVKRGDTVIAPFVGSDGTCTFCDEGLQTSCRNVAFWGMRGNDAGQAEAARVPHADGTLVKIPTGIDEALMPSLLTLTDVFPTGHHAAVSAQVRRGGTVAVLGDGAVGLSGVIAAKRLGAERIILLGRHESRTDLGREFGATDVVAERGEEGVAKVHDLLPDGVESVLECVGHDQSMETAVAIARPGGHVGRVGVPQSGAIPASDTAFFKNVTVSGGVAPARHYIEELMEDVLEGTVQPGRVLDETVDLDGVPEGYRKMNDREALKVMVRP